DGPAGGELAVRAGLVPTKTAADLRHTGPGGVVLAPSDAVRYVRVVLPAGVSGKVTVALASMPFGIAAASPTRVSNGGQATFTMSGTGLHAVTGASLVAPDGSVLRAHRLVHDGERVSAAFDLTGRAAGAYTRSEERRVGKE